MSNIKVGDKVICVDDKGRPESMKWFQQWVEYGEEYTIRDIFYTSPRRGYAVLLEEVHNTPVFISYLGRVSEPSFAMWRFEKVVGQANQEEKEKEEKLVA